MINNNIGNMSSNVSTSGSSSSSSASSSSSGEYSTAVSSEEEEIKETITSSICNNDQNDDENNNDKSIVVSTSMNNTQINGSTVNGNDATTKTETNGVNSSLELSPKTSYNDDASSAEPCPMRAKNGDSSKYNNDTDGLHSSPLFARDGDNEEDDSNIKNQTYNSQTLSPSDLFSFQPVPLPPPPSKSVSQLSIPTLQNLLQNLPSTIFSILPNLKSCLQNYYNTYQSYLHANSYFISLLEDVLHQAIYYIAPYTTSPSNHNALAHNMEYMYVVFHTWSFLNSVVLSGGVFGKGGCGMTLGRLYELSNLDEEDGKKGGNMMESISPILQFTLAVMECIAPIFELHGSTFDYEEEEHHSNTQYKRKITVPTWKRNKAQHHSLYKTWSKLYRVEQLKFMCRAGIVGMYVWRIQQRLKLQQQQQPEEEKTKKGKGSDVVSVKDGALCAGILQEGGALRPACHGGGHHHDDKDDVRTIQEEEEEMERVCYVGRRTGRRLIKHDVNGQTRFVRNDKMQQQNKDDKESISKTAKKKILQLIQTTLTKITNTTNSKTPKKASQQIKHLLLLTMGEFLHLYRPLYWSKQMKHHHYQLCNTKELVNHRSVDLWIPLMKSFIMDVSSHFCSTMALSQTTTTTTTGKRGGGTNSMTIRMNEATKEELQRRKVRWMLYLLRSPVWDFMTNHIMTKTLTRVVWYCLPRWIGRPLIHYVLDVLLYWQRHHFMLEG